MAHAAKARLLGVVTACAGGLDRREGSCPDSRPHAGYPLPSCGSRLMPGPTWKRHGRPVWKVGEERRLAMHGRRKQKE